MVTYPFSALYVRAHTLNHMCVRTRKLLSKLAVMTRNKPPDSSAPRSSGVPAWAALLRVHAAVVPEVDRDLQAATGLPLAWYDVLLELNSAPDNRLLMSELGTRVVLSRTRVSRVVDEMERAGLVERQAHRTDRRATYTRLTAAGRRQFRSAAPVYLRGIAHHFARYMNAKELTTIATGLERVLDRELP
jgi:DNA-binding MarR family transcriptional regulator